VREIGEVPGELGEGAERRDLRPDDSARLRRQQTFVGRAAGESRHDAVPECLGDVEH